MNHSYELITAAAIEAIEAMARHPRDTVICDADSLLSIAACIYWSWSTMVGDNARQVDCDRMILVIGELQEKRKAHALSMSTDVNSRKGDGA